MKLQLYMLPCTVYVLTSHFTSLFAYVGSAALSGMSVDKLQVMKWFGNCLLSRSIYFGDFFGAIPQCTHSDQTGLG